MKLTLILAILLFGEAFCLAKHKSGGNCGILAGNFEGRYKEYGSDETGGFILKIIDSPTNQFIIIN